MKHTSYTKGRSLVISLVKYVAMMLRKISRSLVDAAILPDRQNFRSLNGRFQSVTTSNKSACNRKNLCRLSKKKTIQSSFNTLVSTPFFTIVSKTLHLSLRDGRSIRDSRPRRESQPFFLLHVTKLIQNATFT